jgi:Arc/MetJ family transcription regulator
MYIMDVFLICIEEMCMGKTTVVIDEELVRNAMKAIGARSKREAIEEGLRALVRQWNRKALARELGTFDLDLTLAELESLRDAG